MMELVDTDYLKETMIAAWVDGYTTAEMRLTGSHDVSGEDRAQDFALSATFDSLPNLPDIYTVGDAKVWVVRSIVAKEQKIMPLDRWHYVFAVPHDWSPNTEDIQTLNDTVSKASMEMAGQAVRAGAPTTPSFN